MGTVLGKNHQVKQGNLGAAAASTGTVIFQAPATGTIYLLDWINILVRDGTTATAYVEISIETIEGTDPVIINVALVDSGVPTALGTYSVFLQGLGLPVLADGSSVSATVTLKDVTGAATPTTAVNGLMIGAWGLKQYPYIN
jgi:hypothetical protein